MPTKDNPTVEGWLEKQPPELIAVARKNIFGAGLADPKKLLEGEGKRIQYIKVWNMADAKNSALAKLIAATW